MSSESCVNCERLNTESLFHLCSCGNPFGYLVFQRFHRANIDWNYSRKEEDWCRIVLSMSDGSSRAGNLLRIYKSLMVVDRYSFNQYPIYIILAEYPASLETLSPGLSPPPYLVPLSPLSYSSLAAFYPPSLGLPGFAQDNCIPEILFKP